MERETGIEPATNSLEGCDSTTELLPPRTWKLEHRNSNLQRDEFPVFEPGGQGRVRTSVGHMGRQIYSLLLLTTQPPVRVEFLSRQAGMRPPLARARESRHYNQDKETTDGRRVCESERIKNPNPAWRARAAHRGCHLNWSWRRDSNPRPSDYKSDALPAELRQPQTPYLSR
jgi:hypothetical protein